MSSQEINRIIEEYGGEILHSEVFARAGRERHHVRSSIAAHSLRVAGASLRIADALGRIGVRLDARTVVLGALCHDLGLLDRDTKYAGAWQRLTGHPKESERIACALLPEMEEKTRLVITRHMFPLVPLPPRSGEGAAVILADKIVSVREILGMYGKERTDEHGQDHR